MDAILPHRSITRCAAHAGWRPDCCRRSAKLTRDSYRALASTFTRGCSDGPM